MPPPQMPLPKRAEVLGEYLIDKLTRIRSTKPSRAPHRVARDQIASPSPILHWNWRQVEKV
jgi:hypothetical protein